MGDLKVMLDLNENIDDEFREGFSEAMEDVGDLLVSYIRRIGPVDTGEFIRSVDWVKINDARIIVGSSDKPGKVKALEAGWSDQAPNGVFKVSVRRNKQEIRMQFIEKIRSSI